MVGIAVGKIGNGAQVGTGVGKTLYSILHGPKSCNFEYGQVGIEVGKIGNGRHIRLYMVRNHIKSNLHEKSNMCLARQKICI